MITFAFKTNCGESILNACFASSDGDLELNVLIGNGEGLGLSGARACVKLDES